MTWRRSSWKNQEKPKDHEALPDTLGTGYHEEHTYGGLYIYLQHQPALYVVLGKYMYPQKDGVLFYVSDYTHNSLVPEKVFKFDHLLLAIAQVHELINKFEERNKG